MSFESAAPRNAWYRSDGLRWYRTLRGDTSWWITVSRSPRVVPALRIWPVLKEKYDFEVATSRRFQSLLDDIATGTWVPPRRVALFRFHGER
jgi:hypothetical protein